MSHAFARKNHSAMEEHQSDIRLFVPAAIVPATNVVSGRRTQSECLSLDWYAFAYDAWKNSQAKAFGNVKDTPSYETLIRARDQHIYEVVQNTLPARLFLDVEWKCDASTPLKERQERLEEIFPLLRDFIDREDSDERVVLSCQRPNKEKASFHVIFPGVVMASIDSTMKRLVLGFKAWLEREGHGRVSEIIDGKVYSKNRNFRLFNQSKHSDDTKTPFTYDQESSHPQEAYLHDVSRSLVQLSTKGKKDAITLKLEDVETVLKTHKLVAASREEMKKRQKGAVMGTNGDWQMPAIVEKKPTTTQPKLCYRGGSVTIKEDSDLLTLLEAKTLRAMDFETVFIPVLVSLCASRRIDEDKLLTWIDSKSEQCNKYRLHYGMKKARPLLVSCQYAINVLSEAYDEVIDERPEVRCKDPMVKVIEPQSGGEWQEIHAGDELRKRLTKEMWHTDKKTDKEKKQTYIVGGKMGVGKTQAVLEYLVNRALKKHTKVIYVAPRISLVDQITLMTRDIRDARLTESAAKKKRHTNTTKSVTREINMEVHAMHGKTDKDKRPNIRDEDLGEWDSVITVVCVNSLHRIDYTPHVVVVDEANTVMGNIFINFNQHMNHYTPPEKNDDGKEKDLLRLDTDMACMARLAQNMQCASGVIIMEAAFNRHLIESCMSMRRCGDAVDLKMKKKKKGGPKVLAPREAHKKKEKKKSKKKRTKKEIQWKMSAGERKRMKQFVRNCRRRNTVATMMGGKMYMETPPVMFSVCNTEYGMMIEHLEEYDDAPTLKLDILYTIYGERKTCIIYTSTARESRCIETYIKAQASNNKMPLVLTVNSDVMKVEGGDDAEAFMDNAAQSYGVIITNVLSCGYSYTATEMDIAYAFFNFSMGAPPLPDMVQLCARFRRVKSKTLRYNVSGNRILKKSDITESQERAMTERTRVVMAAEGGTRGFRSALTNYAKMELTDLRRMCTSLQYARSVMKESLITAFSKQNEGFAYSRPTYVKVTKQRQDVTDLMPTYGSTKYRARQYAHDMKKVNKHWRYADNVKQLGVTRTTPFEMHAYLAELDKEKTAMYTVVDNDGQATDMTVPGRATKRKHDADTFDVTQPTPKKPRTKVEKRRRDTKTLKRRKRTKTENQTTHRRTYESEPRGDADESADNKDVA